MHISANNQEKEQRFWNQRRKEKGFEEEGEGERFCLRESLIGTLYRLNRLQIMEITNSQ